MITSRGNPNGPNLDGDELEEVHFCIPVGKYGEFDDDALCMNGKFNIRWTKEIKEVTCLRCLEKLRRV